MTMRSKFVVGVAITVTLSAVTSTVHGQVLPRNRAQREANQAGQNVRTEAPRAQAGAAVGTDGVQAGAAVDTQRGQAGAAVGTQRGQTGAAVDTQRNVRTEVDTNVRRSAGAATAGSDVSILRSTQLVGTMISVQGNRNVGKITEIVFNEDGCIWYVVADVNGRMAAIPWQAGNYDMRSRVFLLDDFDVTRIERIPTFTNWQQLSEQTFVSEINDFYRVGAASDVQGRTDSVIRSSETQGTSRTTQQSDRVNANQRSRTTTQDQEGASSTNRTDVKSSSNADQRSNSGQKSNAANGTNQKSTSDRASSSDQKSTSDRASSSDQKSTSGRASSSDQKSNAGARSDSGKSTSQSKSGSQGTDEGDNAASSSSKATESDSTSEKKSQETNSEDPANTAPKN